MKRYKTFVAEAREATYPTWVKAAAVLMVTRVRTNANAVKQAVDVERKLDLIADQNKQIAYLMALAVGVDKGKIQK